MTIRLREAADSQRRERLHLADAMADISPPAANAADGAEPNGDAPRGRGYHA